MGGGFATVQEAGKAHCPDVTDVPPVAKAKPTEVTLAPERYMRRKEKQVFEGAEENIYASKAH